MTIEEIIHNVLKGNIDLNKRPKQRKMLEDRIFTLKQRRKNAAMHEQESYMYEIDRLETILYN